MLQDSSQSTGMFGVGSAGVPFTAGPLSANPVMTSNSSSSKASASAGKLSDKSALPRHNTTIPLASALSSGFNKCSYPTEPKSLVKPAGRMLTQTSILEIPRSAKYYDLTWFLRHTGPEGIYDGPKRTGSTTSSPSTSKGAFRFFKKGNKAAANPEPTAAVSEAHKDLNDILLFDKGGLLVQNGVEQKVTLTGKPYLALKVSSDRDVKSIHDARDALPTKGSTDLKSAGATTASTNTAERHLSEISTLTASHEWLLKYNGRAPSPVSPIDTPEPPKKTSSQENVATVHQINVPSSPIRPAASNPPTPPAEPATTIAQAYQFDLSEHPAKFSVNFTDCVSKGTKDTLRKPVTPMPTLVLRDEEFPVNIPRLGRECDMQHPAPRRLASHSVLHRASSLVEAALSRSATQSPGTPPPKSPLRVRRDDFTIERTLESDADVRKRRTAPTVEAQDEVTKRGPTIVPTVTTECTGPLTRNAGHTRAPVKHMLYPASRREREERARARKLRDRSNSMARTIDTLDSGPPTPPRRRLRKVNRQSTIPEVSDLKPAPLATRSSPGSSKKITEKIAATTSSVASPQHFEVTHNHSRGSSITTVDTPATISTMYSPISESKGRTDSGMLLAEQVPLPKTKSPFRPTRIVVAKERVYTPRPRSASMPRSAGKTRSRNSVSLPSRVLTPEMPKDRSTTPPLPTPPPNRALPPTPPASGSEKVTKKPSKDPAAFVTPEMGSAQDWTHPPILNKNRQYVPPRQAYRSASQPPEDVSQLQSRNAYLEKQNRMLEAALMAVLNTNGESNVPLHELLGNTSPKCAMTWEDRVTRRGEASHAASSSNGSALDFYLSTKRGSKVLS